MLVLPCWNLYFMWPWYWSEKKNTYHHNTSCHLYYKHFWHNLSSHGQDFFSSRMLLSRNCTCQKTVTLVTAGNWKSCKNYNCCISKQVLSNFRLVSVIYDTLLTFLPTLFESFQLLKVGWMYAISQILIVYEHCLLFSTQNTLLAAVLHIMSTLYSSD